MIIALIVISVLLFGFICWREYQHDKERKDLYNRIMAVNLEEYAVQSNEKPPPRGRNFVSKGLEKSSNELGINFEGTD